MSGAALDTVRTVADLRERVARWRAAGERVALVPTMGAIHDGHCALVRAVRQLPARAVASIFVNPRQFGPREDFAAYPRREAEDAALLAAAGADLLYAPTVEEMYPPGFATNVSVAGVSEGLCGAARPGHFDGVATVVAKLLLQCRPDAAIFGEKDYQQLMVIRRVARDLDIAVEIIGWPTQREADGLALSSRNAYLAPEERAVAPALYRVLGETVARLQRGAQAAAPIAAAITALRDAGFQRIDYMELRDAETLAPVDRASRPARLLAAAWLGKARLIDNVAVVPGG